MDLRDIKGIGPKKIELLRKLNIETISDLYNYYPREYEDRTNKTILPKANSLKKYYFIWKIISKVYQTRTRSGIISYVYAKELSSNSENIKVIWFNDRFSPQKLEEGKEYKFYTKVTLNNGHYEAINPLFCELESDEIGQIVSIYPLTKGINQRQISGFIKESLQYFDNDEEILDRNILNKFKLNTKLDNLKNIHFPNDKNSLLKSKSEIKIHDYVRELLFLDYINGKYTNKQNLKLKYDLDYILSLLDFKLTRSQLISLNEILKDCNLKKTMNRLLIGDVGSGKTIIAIIAMIIFAKNHYQSAMMVPTEVLANQQYQKNIKLFNKLGIKAELLTGSVKNKDIIKEKLLNGDIDIIIGTHALIENDVIFKNLKLAINDEQHRFGVKQRQLLSLKSDSLNYLTMTATPIPRTISLRISKILDLSIINELPHGRKPIKTQIIAEVMEKALFDRIYENISSGRQVYVVSNNIDSEDRNSVENLYKRYKKEFKNLKIKKLHGNMSSSDKDKTLKSFNEGNIDILISTTVIEVGIDVSNANFMIIYNANNFGLSQLHQLRGRVGRGSFESFCYLITNRIDNQSKLNILVNNENGFDIAKKDYDMRGGGKILSSIQHGRNLDEIEYLNMSNEEIDRSFEIFEACKKDKFIDVNFNYIKKFFAEEKRIILN